MKARIWVADRGDLRVTMLGHTVSRLDQRPQSVQEKLSSRLGCPPDFSHFGFQRLVALVSEWDAVTSDRKASAGLSLFYNF